MLTRGGIAYDLNKSPYKHEVIYNNEEITFVFSGEYNLNSFKNKLNENRERISESLTKRFKLDITCDLLADIKLYTSIEKRGFLIERNEDKITCLNIIKLDGLNLTTKN